MGEMLLRGTTTHSKKEIDSILGQMGARLDVDVRSDMLVFRGAALSSQLNAFATLFKEILTTPAFPPEELKKLKSETISALQEELGHDGALAIKKFSEFLFLQHPYGHPIAGRSKDIEKIQPAQLLAHYKNMFQTSKLLILGSGDADSSRITEWAQTIAFALPDSSTDSRDKQIPVPKNTPHKRLLIIDKPERTQTQIWIGQIGALMTDPRFFALHLGNTAFGGSSFASILMEEIRSKRGWSYGASSYFRFGLQPRSWQAHLFPAEKDTAAALEHTLKLITALQTEGLTQEKFDFTQKVITNNAGFLYDTPEKRVENKLLEKVLYLPPGFMTTYQQETQKLTREQVNQALHQFIKPEQLAIVVLGTASHLKSALANATGIPEAEVIVVPYNQE
jgi:zinc protease